MVDDAEIREAMREIARRRWARATQAEKIAQGRLMVAGRRRRRAAKLKAALKVRKPENQ